MNNTLKQCRAIWNEKVRIEKVIIDSETRYYLLDENYDFIKIIKEYLDMIVLRGSEYPSPNTVKTYCYHFWYFIVFLKMNDLEILDLDGKPYILAKFKLWLQNPFRFYDNIDLFDYDMEFDGHSDMLKDSTINLIISTVSSLYNWLKSSEKIEENPVIYKTMITTQLMKDKDMLAHTKKSRTITVNSLKISKCKKKPVTISEKNFKKILESVNLLRDKIILLCLKEGGFRIGELLGIHLGDVDFANQGIYVKFRPDNENKTRAKAGYGKDRFVSLDTDLMILIQEYIVSEWLNSKPKNDFLFIVVNSSKTQYNGQPMKNSTIYSMVRQCYKKTSINFNPHMLRHTHATELVKCYIDKGEHINWKFISERLGHCSVITTMETYIHLDVEDYKKEYKKIEKYRSQNKGRK